MYMSTYKSFLLSVLFILFFDIVLHFRFLSTISLWATSPCLPGRLLTLISPQLWPDHFAQELWHVYSTCTRAYKFSQYNRNILIGSLYIIHTSFILICLLICSLIAFLSLCCCHISGRGCRQISPNNGARSREGAGA